MCSGNIENEMGLETRMCSKMILQSGPGHVGTPSLSSMLRYLDSISKATGDLYGKSGLVFLERNELLLLAS